MELSILATLGILLWLIIFIGIGFIIYFTLPFTMAIVSNIIKFASSIIMLPLKLLGKGNNKLQNKAKGARKKFS